MKTILKLIACTPVLLCLNESESFLPNIIGGIWLFGLIIYTELKESETNKSSEL